MLSWFVIIGSLAALTHALAYVCLTHFFEQALPELLNAAAFLVAFMVSFWGHRKFSFRETSVHWFTSLLRFALSSVAGLATNELVFSLLLRQFGLPAVSALLIAMVFAAGQTFLLGRFWAFRR